jgi:diguanylate cyclase (GGDEF)-like protein
MPTPLQLFAVLDRTPDLATSAYGPFVLHPAADLDALAEMLRGQSGCDAVVIGSGQASALAAVIAWGQLPRIAADTAVVLVAPEPPAAEVVRLMQLGVQDVIPSREASDERMASAVRQAVERKRLEAAARRAFATDLGTGLPNHSQLMEHMTHLLALREREPAPMALLALRVEGLSTAEAHFGLEAANVLRRKVAVRLRSGLRASDVVASIGADSFAVLLAWMDDPSDGDRVGAKLVQLLRRPFTVAGQEVLLSVTVGIGQYPAHSRDAAALLHRALAQAAGMAAIGRGSVAQRITADPGSNAANDPP